MLFGNKISGTIAYLAGVWALPPQFTRSLRDMIIYNNECLCGPGEQILYTEATASYHAFARNSLVDQMRGDWLLMLDTDHEFEPDLAARMVFAMAKHGVDVLTGLYQYKSPPHSPVLHMYDREKDAFWAIGDWSADCEIFEIGGAGGGVLMVRRRVFDRIREELNEAPFEITPPFSEDLSFFRRLNRLGIKPYCAPRIEAHHLSPRALSMERDYQRGEVAIGPHQNVEAFK